VLEANGAAVVGGIMEMCDAAVVMGAIEVMIWCTRAAAKVSSAATSWAFVADKRLVPALVAVWATPW
jgi:hypothetical protein